MVLGHVKVKAQNCSEGVVVVLLEVVPPQISLSSLKIEEETQEMSQSTNFLFLTIQFYIENQGDLNNVSSL